MSVGVARNVPVPTGAPIPRSCEECGRIFENSALSRANLAMTRHPIICGRCGAVVRKLA